MNLSSLREQYSKSILSEDDVEKDPMAQVIEWLGQAVASQVKEPNAMMLSTVGKDLKPSSRIVLLKKIDKEGFCFFTNYESKKAQQLEENNQACLLFYWPELERQIRIEGEVSKTSPSDSQAYFEERPEGSQISAIISPQSSVISSREELEEKYNTFKKLEIPTICPTYWGGYLLKPTYYEFWQGREHRLHDRIIFKAENKAWKIERLAP